MRRIVLSALPLFLAHGAAHAALMCPDRAPAQITSVSAASLKCQETIANEGSKFVRKQMAVLTACKLKEPAGTCPRSQDADAISTAANKAAEKIAGACGSSLAGLTSSYKNFASTAEVSSCLLSQHSVVGEGLAWNGTGATGESWPTAAGKERENCQKEVAKWGRLFMDKARQNATVCIKKQMKAGTPGDLAALCIGSFSGGAFVPPGDTKTAEKQGKLLTQLSASLAKKCTVAETNGFIPTLFGCAGSNTIADLEQCLACTGWSGTFDMLDQQYAEKGKFVANGPVDAIQAAVDLATDGDKLLIGSGTYAEEVVVAHNNFSLVGCGAATGNRPKVVPPSPEGTAATGIDANAVTNILFQSIAVEGQDNNGIRTTNSNGVIYRDIVADGLLTSAYAIFPRTCNNVVVELCKTKRCNDSPLYVGQSSTILVRWNDVRDSVAAIEIENSGNAQVYSNYATGNTAGMLVFKDGSLPVQLAECHDVHHNVLENNNRTNFGGGTVGKVPDGSGLLIVSADKTAYHHNILRGNNSFGIALTDDALGGLPVAAEQDPQSNFFYANLVAGNALSPDFVAPNGLPDGVAADFLAIAFNADLIADGNCAMSDLGNISLTSNIYDTQIGLTSLPACTLPVPAFLGCPAPPVP